MISDIAFIILAVAGIVLLLLGAAMVSVPLAYGLGGLACLRVASDLAKSGDVE
jgi:hypothetical protein